MYFRDWKNFKASSTLRKTCVAVLVMNGEGSHPGFQITYTSLVHS